MSIIVDVCTSMTSYDIVMRQLFKYDSNEH